MVPSASLWRANSGREPAFLGIAVVSVSLTVPLPHFPLLVTIIVLLFQLHIPLVFLPICILDFSHFSLRLCFFIVFHCWFWLGFSLILNHTLFWGIRVCLIVARDWGLRCMVLIFCLVLVNMLIA